uniref:EF-hand domain-containing protein n=1 Tax=Romanomermis culicivorax TaxID=13658 RepID=A0A915KLV9_ROMCU
MGFEPKSEEIKQMLKTLKCDAKCKFCTKISFDQFTEIVRKKSVEKDTKLEITKAFKLFDHENSGKITVEDLRRVADELGEKISDQELQEMITEADLDHDGQVNEDEFYRIMKKTSLY